MTRLVVFAICACIAGGLGSACAANQANCGSGPCVTDHRWSTNEVASVLFTVLFPPHANRRDHLYDIQCRLTHGDAGATCTGHRTLGRHPHRLVTVRAVLRSNGSWDMICWPDPSTLCDPVQIREQEKNQITTGSE